MLAIPHLITCKCATHTQRELLLTTLAGDKKNELKSSLLPKPKEEVEQLKAARKEGKKIATANNRVLGFEPCIPWYNNTTTHHYAGATVVN